MQLGAKVERPAPKKPDPIKEFETGDHTHEGVMLPLEYAQSLRDTWRRGNPEIEAAYRQFETEVQKWIGFPAKAFTLQSSNTTATALAMKLAETAARTELMQDFKTLSGMYTARGLDFNPFEIRKAAGVAIDARPTNEQLSQMIDHMLDVLYGSPPAKVIVRAPSWADEPPQSPAQEAKAKKMAEIQKAKQELRSMVKKSY